MARLSEAGAQGAPKHVAGAHAVPANWRYAVFTLIPAVLLVAGALGSVLATVASILYMTVFAFAADELGRPPPYPAGRDIVTDILPLLIGLAHVPMLGMALFAIANSASAPIAATHFLGFGWFFGTIGMANAHELIHRSPRLARGLGKWVLISMLFGHHASAHVLVHHVHVATPRDPNSAPRGRSLYRFFISAWIGSFIAGFRAESARIARGGAQGRGAPGRITGHPYAIYCLGAAATLAWVAVLFGAGMLLPFMALAVFSHGQLIVSDYVQHYGLRRRKLANGRFEPAADRHSWNAPFWFTATLTMNAASHSDHHANPGRSFTELRPRIEGQAPVLPHSIPFMALIALIPPWWFAVMNPRLDAWTRALEPAGQSQG